MANRKLQITAKGSFPHKNADDLLSLNCYLQIQTLSAQLRFKYTAFLHMPVKYHELNL